MMWLVYILIGIISLIVAGIIGLNVFAQLQRKRELALTQTIDQTDLSNDPILADIDPNNPALLYFTSPMCAPCKTIQRPAIESLQAQMPELPVITIDVMDSPDIAERWHVMSLPRTFIIGKNRKLSATNMEVASAEVLSAQIETAKTQMNTRIQISAPTKKGFSLPKISLAQPQPSNKA